MKAILKTTAFGLSLFGLFAIAWHESDLSLKSYIAISSLYFIVLYIGIRGAKC